MTPEPHGVVPAGEKAPFKERWLAVLRTLFVGFWASAADFGLLAACVRWLRLGPMPARFVSLVLSGTLAFYGNRSFAFRAQSGNVATQATRFIVAEALALPINLLSFRMCVSGLPFVAPEFVSLLASALVFISFSYPVRRFLIFRKPS